METSFDEALGTSAGYSFLAFLVEAIAHTQ